MKLFDIISNDTINLNNTEKKIIDYILERTSTFNNIKITDIANDLFISSNTVIRLCKKLGYTGFSQLKYEIVNFNTTLDTKEITSSNFSLHDSVIKTLSLNKSEDIQAIVKLICTSNRIVIFSLGLSQYPAIAFSKKLQYLKKMCLVPSDRDENILFANNIEEDDLAIIISNSGSTDIIKKISGIVKTKNVPIISLTGFSQNFLSQTSDISLYAYLKEHKLNNHDLTSRLGFNILLDLIFDELIEIDTYRKSL